MIWLIINTIMSITFFITFFFGLGNFIYWYCYTLHKNKDSVLANKFVRVGTLLLMILNALVGIYLLYSGAYIFQIIGGCSLLAPLCSVILIHIVRKIEKIE